MNIAEEPIFQFLSQYAYQPNMVYLIFIGMMLISAVGFPMPEEVTLISVGLLAFIGNNPQLFPPPFEGAPSVNIKTAAIFAFFVVLLSDFVIYSLGRLWGKKILKLPLFKKFLNEERWSRIERWTHRYGAYTCGLFRFTPGLRFPGHLATGMMRFPIWKFLLIDGVAALISVPTQIYLIGNYGESILVKLKELKLVVLSVLLVLVVIYFVRKHFFSLKVKTNSSVP